MKLSTINTWLPAAAAALRLRPSDGQTHGTSHHRSFDISFSQVTLQPTEYYSAIANAELEWSYVDAEDELIYAPSIESFVTFDLDYSWFNYLDDYLSSARLKLYSIGSFEEADFDMLADNGSLSLDLDASCRGSCWVEIDVTDGLLWTIDQQPGLAELTVRISSYESAGVFASSANDGYSPELVIEFDRHANLAEVQLRLMNIRKGRKKLIKGDKKGHKKKNKKPTKQKPAGAKRPNKPGKRPGQLNRPEKPRPNNKPGKRPGQLNRPEKPGKRPQQNRPGKHSAQQNKPGKKPNANKKPNKKPSASKQNVKPKPQSSKGPKPKPGSTFASTTSTTTSDNGKHGPSPQDMEKISNTPAAKEVFKILSSKSSYIDNKLFLYESPADGWIPSTIYKSDGLRKGLEVMNEKGVNGMYFYLGGDGSDKEYKYGLVNVAAFLAQSMKETIKYDACDENSWDLVNGKYPLSNACGQLHQSYQDYHCPDHERHMECPVDPDMEITAVTHAKWFGAPAPLFCRPKKDKNDFTGFWNHGFFCNVPWVDPPITCDDYEGQKAGRFENDEPYANRNGRTDVEGCCWWGRGVIQTTGVCNFGKLNYYLGARAAKEGRDAPYAKYDFCKDPEVICSSEENKELKWIAGMFYWMESVQNYESDGWNYMAELRAFVDGGYKDPGFINAVSGIVNRGCHNPPCGTGAVDGGPERSKNFELALGTFGLIKTPKDGGKGGVGGQNGSPKTVCGADWQTASKCDKNMKECESSLDCAGGEFCWAGVVC